MLWPQGLLSKLGRILGLLSVLALAQYGFKIGFSEAARLLLEYYDNLVGALVGWMQPFLQELLRLFDLNLQIQPHWKHIFVLLGIYFFRSAGVNFAYGYRTTAIFGLIWGLIVALLTSVIAGTVSFIGVDQHHSFRAALIPIGGILIFDVGKQLWNATFIRPQAAQIYGRPEWTWWEFFGPNLHLVFTQGLGSFFVVWILLQLPSIQALSSPGLAAIGILVVALAFYRMAIAANEVGELRKKGDTWLKTLERTNSAGIAIAMLGLFFWVFVFLVTNAGLRFYGL